MRHLAWLALSSEEGSEYWAAMQIMGRYAAANHEVIHRHVVAALGLESMLVIENHHNFAWKKPTRRNVSMTLRHLRDEIGVAL